MQIVVLWMNTIESGRGGVPRVSAGGETIVKALGVLVAALFVCAIMAPPATADASSPGSPATRLISCA